MAPGEPLKWIASQQIRTILGIQAHSLGGGGEISVVGASSALDGDGNCIAALATLSKVVRLEVERGLRVGCGYSAFRHKRKENEPR